MTDIARAQQALVHRILEGDGTASPAERRAAFENNGVAPPLATLVEKTVAEPSAITDHDVVAARTAGLTEDQIFEIVVCAAVGQSMRQYQSARAALSVANRRE
jgi:hypothetical protein